MPLPTRTVIALLLVPFLAACGGGGAAVQSVSSKPAPRPRTVVRAPTTQPPPAAHVQVLPGLEGVIGSTSAQLARLFGDARLDVMEGDARKVQFSGTACVLDVYLYPASPGREPQATYVDARRASDGLDVDRVACINALRRR